MGELSSRNVADAAIIWRFSTLQWLAFLITGSLLVIAAFNSLEFMVNQWSTSEEYGYAFMIPAVVVFLVWQKKNDLARVQFNGSWTGWLLLVAGGVLLLIGELSALYVLKQYAFLMALAGLILAITGWRGFRLLMAPLAIMFFMIPLPNFIYQNLSAELQLISSRIGVAVIRMFDIGVYLEGNVIDLGTYKLQVAEACSGLRYLFPLTSLAYIAAYIYKGEVWKKATIFLSSIPITVFMNSFRVGVIGVLVEYGGISQAEGFLHYFEGWIVFMGCMGILVIEMWILSHVGKLRSKSLWDVFFFFMPGNISEEVCVVPRKFSVPFLASVPVIIALVVSSVMVGERVELIPQRDSFVEFPLNINGWSGKSDMLERIYLDTLKLDDYLLVNYTNADGRSINLYSAYYSSQRKGASIHSPKSCIPGGGWQIEEHDVVRLPGINAGGEPLKVNRLLIRRGENAQLVYYWFQGRGRIITNEYVVKWYLFWDSLTKNRTDGALVRLTTSVNNGTDIHAADALLPSFAADIAGSLDSYIPR